MLCFKVVRAYEPKAENIYMAYVHCKCTYIHFLAYNIDFKKIKYDMYMYIYIKDIYQMG